MMQVRRQLVRNVFSSWFAYLVRIAITFLFVPYITTVLGDARYGVWVIIFQTIFYFSLLDAGLTSALTRYISKFLATREFDKINRVLNTANILYFIVGALVMLGIWGFVTFAFSYFQISDPEVVAEGKLALLILGAFMAFNFAALPFGNSLSAFHRYDVLNMLAIGEEIVRTLLMVYMLSQGRGLVALALVILMLTVVRHLLGAGLLLKLYPEVNIGREYADKPTARMLFGYSKISFGISVCWLVLFNTDELLLGVISSAGAAGVYHPGAQLVRYLRNLINAAALPLIPAISHKETQGDLQPVRELYLKAVRYVSYLSFAIGAGVVIYAESFVMLWLPPEFLEAGRVMQILAVGTTILLPQIIGHSILFGIEQHGKLLIVLVIESILKLGLSIYLIPRYGLSGMAIAVSAPQVILFSTLFPFLVSRALGLSYFRVIGTTLLSGLVGLAIALPLAWSANWAIVPDTWVNFFVGIGMVMLAVLGGAWLVALPEDRAKVREWF